MQGRSLYRATPLAGPFTLATHSVVQTRVARRDWSLLLALTVSVTVSLCALLWSYQHGLVLAYVDSQAHLNIARRVLDSLTPGVAQLGTVWLPVPHLLLQPFIYNDWLWRTGLAGSIVGFLCFQVASLMLFLSIRLIARHELAAWVGLAVFLSDPGVLYVQSTGLTEPVLLMSMTASTYFLLRWSHGNRITDLLLGGILAMVAVGSRYDGWLFAVVAGLLVFFTAHLRWRDAARSEGITMAFLALPIYAMLLWLLYNWLIFGDALAFLRNQFSSYTFVHHASTRDHLATAVATYNWTVLDDLGGIVVALGLAGLGVYLARTRMRGDSLLPYAFLSSYPFNIASLWLGQTTIANAQSVPPGAYNVRYGLVMLPGAVLFIAYLVDALIPRLRPHLVGSIFILALALQAGQWIHRWPDSVPVIAEGRANDDRAQVAPSAAFLHAHYRGGRVLLDDTVAPSFMIGAGLDMREYIANFSGDLWRRALRDPDGLAEWIVFKPHHGEDRVWQRLGTAPLLTRHYVLAFQSGNYVLYHHKVDEHALRRSQVPIRGMTLH